MKIQNVQLKGIEAKRYTDLTTQPKKVRIDHNSNISRLEKIQDDRASVDFQYTASYGPVGLIKIEGQLHYIGENIETLVNEWNDKRKMPNDIASGIHTAIMHACVPEAVGIAKDLRLPSPIPLPQVRMGKPGNTQQVKGGLGPEFA
jgi:hypothetical protein